MKKLGEIMKKYGLNFRPVQLGYSYFFGAEIAADGAHIYLPHGCEAGRAFARFQRYCSRYGYTLRLFGMYPDCTVYSVCRAMMQSGSRCTRGICSRAQRPAD